MASPNGVVCVLLVLVCSSEVFGKTVDNHRNKRTVAGGTGVSCENVKPFFDVRNISLPPLDNPKGFVCGGNCCSNETENILRKQGQRDFASLLQHNSKSLQGLLNSTATTLQSHISEVTRQSENRTLFLFTQVYATMSTIATAPLGSLYYDIRRYIHINSSRDPFSVTNIDIKSSVNQFFTQIFPLVYHQSVLKKQGNKDFSFDYKTCLRQTINEVQPFRDIPRNLGQSLSRSLEATRLFLQALDIGVEVLNATDTLLMEDNGKNNAECHEALLKMTYCPKCLGLPGGTRPCSGYCLNVLRGCLTKYVAELDSPWNGYVEGIERLVNAMKQHNNEGGVNADAVIKELTTEISQAIMYTMEKGEDIGNRVKRICGVAKYSDKEDPAMSDTTTLPSVPTTKPRAVSSRNFFTPLPETQLVYFLTSIAKTKGFYGNLADSLCQDESFAEPKDQRCWNGERIGEYTKTVVAAGPDMQKYNPEVKLTSTNLQNVDPRVANLADKLRHVHQMIMSSLGGVSLPESDSFMQGDGADGSGSGMGPGDSEDDESVRGSGSGHGPIHELDVSRTVVEEKPEPPRSLPPQSAGASRTDFQLVAFVVLLFSLLSHYHY